MGGGVIGVVNGGVEGRAGDWGLAALDHAHLRRTGLKSGDPIEVMSWRPRRPCWRAKTTSDSTPPRETVRSRH